MKEGRNKERNEERKEGMKKQRSKVLEEGGKGERSNYIISKTIIKGKYVNIFFSFYISINICCYLFFYT